MLKPTIEQVQKLESLAKLVYDVDYLTLFERGGKVEVLETRINRDYSLGTFNTWLDLAKHIQERLHIVCQQMKLDSDDIVYELTDPKPDFREARGILRHL